MQTSRQFRGRAVRRTRSGITLLELLIALSLMVMLLGAVGAALTIYMQTGSMGRERTERSQIVRALYLQLYDDIRSTAFPRDPSQTDEDNAELSAAEAAEFEELMAQATLETTEPTDPDDAVTGAKIGLFGDSQRLTLHISRPRRPTLAAPVSDAFNDGTSSTIDFFNETPIAGELRSISWFLAGPNSPGLAGVAAYTNASSRSVGTDTGLARLDRDLPAVRYADAITDLETLGGEVELLAPEVTGLAFRYFDGLTWVDAWDSEVQERLPSAVEVTLEFQPPQTGETSILNGGLMTSSDRKSYRFVIALPMAPPPMTEVQL